MTTQTTYCISHICNHLSIAAWSGIVCWRTGPVQLMYLASAPAPAPGPVTAPGLAHLAVWTAPAAAVAVAALSACATSARTSGTWHWWQGSTRPPCAVAWPERQVLSLWAARDAVSSPCWRKRKRLRRRMRWQWRRKAQRMEWQPKTGKTWWRWLRKPQWWKPGVERTPSSGGHPRLGGKTL